MKNLSWTIATGHFGGTIEAIEPELDAMGRIGIERPHPLHEFSIRVEAAKAMAKSGLLHSFI